MSWTGLLPFSRRWRSTCRTTLATTIEALTASYLDRLAERTPASHVLREQAERVLAGGVSSHFKAWQPFYVREALNVQDPVELLTRPMNIYS